jgi:spore coat protein U-like protein
MFGRQSVGRPSNRRSANALLWGLGIVFSLAPAVALAVNTCTVAATTHAFGAYDTINPASGTSSITVTCSHSTNPAVTFSYTIALSTGPGTYASRQMTGTGDTLTYNLYTSAAHTTVWGNGTAGTVTVADSFVVASGSGRSGFKVDTVYGLITGPQNVRPGAYSTATPITVTVTY